MELAQVVELLEEIKGAYPKFEIYKTTPRVWQKYLSEHSVESTYWRLERHIKESRFEPTIHDLLPTKEDRRREAEEMEIQLNRWVNAGNEPEQFVFKPNPKY